jgi:hypothetical protein
MEHVPVVKETVLGQMVDVIPFSADNAYNMHQLYCCVRYFNKRTVILGPIVVKFYVSCSMKSAAFLPWISNRMWKVARTNSPRSDAMHYNNAEREEIANGSIPGLSSPFVECIKQIQCPLQLQLVSIYEITCYNSKTLKFLFTVLLAGYTERQQKVSIPCFPTLLCAEQGKFMKLVDLFEVRKVLVQTLLNDGYNSEISAKHRLCGEAYSQLDIGTKKKLRVQTGLDGKQPVYYRSQIVSISRPQQLNLNQAEIAKKKPVSKKRKRNEPIVPNPNAMQLIRVQGDSPRTSQTSLDNFVVNQ